EPAARRERRVERDLAAREIGVRAGGTAAHACHPDLEPVRLPLRLEIVLSADTERPRSSGNNAAREHTALAARNVHLELFGTSHDLRAESRLVGKVPVERRNLRIPALHSFRPFRA